MPNPMDAEKNSRKTTKIYMEIIMRTKYNTSNNDTIWEANLSSEKNIKEYYIKSINDKACIFYTFSHTQSVFIIHDDILYRLKISIEMITLLILIRQFKNIRSFSLLKLKEKI